MPKFTDANRVQLHKGCGCGVCDPADGIRVYADDTILWDFTFEDSELLYAVYDRFESDPVWHPYGKHYFGAGEYDYTFVRHG